MDLVDSPIEDRPLAVSRYGPTGASTRVRVYDWFAHFRIQAERSDYLGSANNQAATLLPRIADVARAELKLRGLPAGVKERTLVLSRGASPFSSGGIERSLLRQAGHSVYDFDDAIFLEPRNIRRRIWSEKRVWERSVGAADVVIAGSEVLAEAARAIRKDDVVLIPSCVEPDDYRKKQCYEIMGAPRGVWIGTPATEPFLETIADALLELNRRIGLRITVISAGRATLGRLDSMVDRLDWTPETFHKQLAQADFGLMPLPNTPFERGKCAYKLLQYGAAALPIVGSPVGANVAALNRLGGTSATTRDDWVTAVSDIIAADQSERGQLGEAARLGVEAHYSYAAWGATWLKATSLGKISSHDTKEER